MYHKIKEPMTCAFSHIKAERVIKEIGSKSYLFAAFCDIENEKISEVCLDNA